MTGSVVLVLDDISALERQRDPELECCCNLVEAHCSIFELALVGEHRDNVPWAQSCNDDLDELEVDEMQQDDTSDAVLRHIDCVHIYYVCTLCYIPLCTLAGKRSHDWFVCLFCIQYL